MVVFFTSKAVSPPVTIYMGRDKVENEELLRYGLPTDVWFHVDKLSSAHVYLRQPDGQPHGEWDKLPSALVNDLAQLVKANSIEGNKKDNITVIYTPFPNLKKHGDMPVGQVSFHSDKKVKRAHVPTRDNAIVNRLNKTKVEKEVDHEAEHQERLRLEGRKKKANAIERTKQEAEQRKAWEEEKKAKSYDNLYTDDAFEEQAAASEDDFM
ncbi:cytoplasmic protein [Cryptococcus wingfieldii CBS 7118]|uniref:Cytoplasmic protein n=1 Tax=Cryptococcus wingfieldii CBS 7118 TaxID=1295528 RepID=A0A1E3JCI6_9TREE|nr:cytoplasmic protein [Cryptococcus wingfieldii CBS 7118]ODN98405.1 cytoplasmic protein [Cryptococcus wingfieldii CBS 7118]